MHTEVKIKGYRESKNGTSLIIEIPGKHIGDMLYKKRIHRGELRFDDGRHISQDQRKKAYATIRDIADFTGYLPEECKELLKYLYISRTGEPYFSLSDCSVETAKDFISTILEFAIGCGIPLSEQAILRADDIGRYLYFCLVHKKCCVCGQPGEIHHVDAIGMGRNRRSIDDSGYRKMCLCRLHHTIAHQCGMAEFEKMYKVYGIVAKDVAGGTFGEVEVC